MTEAPTAAQIHAATEFLIGQPEKIRDTICPLRPDLPSQQAKHAQLLEWSFGRSEHPPRPCAGVDMGVREGQIVMTIYHRKDIEEAIFGKLLRALFLLHRAGK